MHKSQPPPSACIKNHFYIYKKINWLKTIIAISSNGQNCQASSWEILKVFFSPACVHIFYLKNTLEISTFNLLLSLRFFSQIQPFAQNGVCEEPRSSPNRLAIL
ncbi:MAG: hypothetical protein IJD65_04825 [Mailhella sp.]|nr:hypothetical protein [Mailhella sp.]